MLGVMVNAWAVKRENVGLNMESSPTIKKKKNMERATSSKMPKVISIFGPPLLAPYN